MTRLFRFFFGGILSLTTITFARGQAFESLHSFSRSEGGGSRAELIQGSNGNFYGTASTGGDTNGIFGYGTIFRVTPEGAVTNLVSFNDTNGASPQAGLIQYTDGNFYGTTYSGGVSNLGTVFKMTTNGGLTTLVSFTNGNGALPMVGLLANNGTFYGTTSAGGASNAGTIYKITTNGDLTTLFEFNGTNGASPQGALISGGDGELYGTTYSGGASNFGTVFKITTNGVLTSLVSFDGGQGRSPQASLLYDNGNFYGTTFFGGATNVGTLFRMSANGELTNLFSFNVTNGAYPQAKLIRGIDGSFYGTTSQGGITNMGTVFQITPGGIFTSLFSFTNAVDGNTPLAGLALGADNNLYGTTFSGGAGIGTVFRFIFPSLNLKQAGNEVILSWSTNATGFTLQSTLNLNSPSTWIDSGNSPAVLDGKFVVTNSTSGNAQFYRLKK